MRNQVQRDSSYPGNRRVRVDRGVAQGRDSKKGKRNRIEKKTERQAAGQEGSIVIEEFPECLSDDLELQCLPQAKGITSHYTFKITSGIPLWQSMSTFQKVRIEEVDGRWIQTGSRCSPFHR